MDWQRRDVAGARRPNGRTLGLACLLIGTALGVVSLPPPVGGGVGPLDAFGYIWVDNAGPGPQIDFTWVDITGTGTNVGPRGDDDVLGPYALGFRVAFYGVDYESTCISNNGLLWLTQNTCPAIASSNTPLPDPSPPGRRIAVYWDDLFTAGNIYYETRGNASNRQFIVSWVNVDHAANPGTGALTFQAILTETSSAIRFQYLDTSYGVPSIDDGASASVGIENDVGTVGQNYSYNTNVVTGGLAVEFQGVSNLIFKDDFTTPAGWTANGFWHLADESVPDPCFGVGFHPASPFNSPRAYAYHDDAGGPNQCTYENGSANAGQLTSPPLDLSTQNRARLTIETYFDTECATPSCAVDDLRVQASADNVTFTTLIDVSDLVPRRYWSFVAVNLTSYAGDPDVWIRFEFDTVDALSNNFGGWYIDNVFVDDMIPSPFSTLTMSAVNLAPAAAQAGQVNVPVLRLDLSVDVGDVMVEGIAVNLSGVPPTAADIDSVNLFRDTGDQTFNPFVDEYLDADLFSGPGPSAFLDAPDFLVTAGTTVYLYLTFDIAAGATVGDYVGARMETAAAVSVAAPDVVDPTSFPVDTYQPGSRTLIAAATADTIVVTGAILAPATAVSGPAFIPMLQLDLRVSANTATVYGIPVALTGLPPNTADISSVVVWVDTGDGVFDAGSDRLWGAALFGTPSVDVYGWPRVGLEGATPVRLFVTYSISFSATIGDWVGANVTNVYYLSPDMLDASSLPIDSYLAGVRTEIVADDVLTVNDTDIAPATGSRGATVPMLRLDLSAGTDDVIVDGLYVTLTGLPPDPADVNWVYLLQDDGDGLFELSDAQVGAGVAGFPAWVDIPPNLVVSAGTPVTLFVAYGLSASATLGNWVGASLTAPSDVVVYLPDVVDPSFAPIDTYQPGLRTQITQDTLTILPTVLAPAVVDQSISYVPMLRLDLSTVAGDIGVAGLTVTISGSPPDPADVAFVSLWQDDGDGSFEVIGDTWIAGGPVSGPTVFLDPSDFFVVVGSPVTLFIAYDTAATATIGNWIGARIDSATDIAVYAADAVDPAAFPIDTYQPGVQTQIAPSVVFVVPTVLAPATATLGAANVPMLRLNLTTNGRVFVDGASVTLSGLPPDPSDLALLSLWRDGDGDGQYSAGDSWLASAVPGGLTTFLDVPDFQLYATNPVTLFVLYSLSPSAVPGHWVGASLPAAADLLVLAPDTVDATAFPIDTYQSGVRTLIVVEDLLVVAATNLAPSTAEAGLNNVPILQLDLSTATASVTMAALTVTHTGLPPDPADVGTVTLWRDDGDGVFEPFAGDSWLDANSVVGATRVLNPNPDIVINAGSPVTLYISFDLAPSATVGNWVGASVASAADMAVVAPDGVDAGAFPIDTYQAGVRTAITTDTLVVTPIVLAPAMVEPGANNVPMLQMDLSTATGDVSIVSVNFTLTGLPPDPADLSYIVVWRDNGDGVFNPASDIVTGQGSWGVDTWRVTPLIPALIVAAGVPVRLFVTLSIASGAPLGDWIGLRIASPNDFDTGVDLVDAAPFPIDTYQPGVRTQIAVDALIVAPTVLAPASVLPGAMDVPMLRLDLSTATGSVTFAQVVVTLTGVPPDAGDVSFLRLWRDDGDGAFSPAVDVVLDSMGGGLSRTLNPADFNVVAGAPVTLFVSVDVPIGATMGHWIGTSIAAVGDLLVVGPDTVDPAPFPIDSYSAGVRTEIVPEDFLVIGATVLAPAAVERWTILVAMLRLDLSTTTGSVRVNQFVFTLTGSSPDPLDIQAVELWEDDGDGVPEYTAGDTRIASGTFGGPTVTFFTNLNVAAGTPVTLFLSYNIDQAAVVGHWIGASLAAATDVLVNLPDVVDPTPFPVDTYAPGVRTEIVAGDVLLITPIIVAPPTVLPGDRNVAMLRLTFSAATGDVGVSCLTFVMTGIPPAPSDLDRVDLWEDDGDGLFSAATDVWWDWTSPAWTFDLCVGDLVVAGTPRTFFLTFDILAAAMAGDWVGVAVLSAANITLFTGDQVDSAPFPFDTYQPGVRTEILPQVLTVTASVLAPGTASRGAANVTMLRLDLSASAGRVDVNAIEIGYNGTLTLPVAAADIPVTRVWRDDGDGVFSPTLDAFLVESSASWNRYLNWPGSISVYAGTPVTLFVTFDVSGTATVGGWFGARMSDTGQVFLVGSGVVDPSPFPIETYQPGVRTQVIGPGNTPPALDWTTEVGYTTDGVEPNTGTIDTSFTFRVRYADADNDPPLGGVVLELYQPPGTDSAGCPCTMVFSTWAGAPGDYRVGAIYEYVTALPVRATDYRYVFTATDGPNLVFTSTADGPDVLNRAPTLTFAIAPYDNGVNPDSAVAGSSFTFQVVFADADNDPPTFIDVALELNGVAIAGSPFAMTAVVPTDTNYVDGALFTATVALATAGTTYELMFEANDGFENATPVGFNAPDVTAATGTIQGTVRSDEGIVAGATVEVLDAGGNVIGSGTTDASGNFAIGNVPFGVYTVRVRAEGYEEKTSSATVSASSPSTDLTVSLVKTAGFAWWLLLIPLIAALALVLFFFMLRKRKKPEEAPPPAAAPAEVEAPPTAEAPPSEEALSEPSVSEEPAERLPSDETTEQ